MSISFQVLPLPAERFAPYFSWSDERLREIGARRMVVGPTVQEKGISSACQARVWRIDVGLAAYYGGTLEVLEIRGDELRALKPAN